jgi:uncharacterized membrane protein
MLYGSTRTTFLLRLLIGVAFVILGVVLHALVMFAGGLVILAVAGVQWFHRRGSGGRS